MVITNMGYFGNVLGVNFYEKSGFVISINSAINATFPIMQVKGETINRKLYKLTKD